MPVLEVKGLCKKYPSFYLDNVGFALEPGRIMGLIGRNGAGKTTTLKSIFNLVHPDSGTIRIFGHNMPEDEELIKQKIGFAGGAIDYYKRRKLRDVASVTSLFFKEWDHDSYSKYLSAFSIDDKKTANELSEGMRVKFSLALALSHHAELLILDEPTSGLDPVSRAEILEIFNYLKDKGVGILFSTHITSDLEKCADDITYIANGKLIASSSLEKFLTENARLGFGGNLEDIMVHYEKESLYEKLDD